MNVFLNLKCLLLFKEFVTLNLKLEHVNILKSFSLLMPQIALCDHLLPFLAKLGHIDLDLLVAVFLPTLLDSIEFIPLLRKLLMFKLPVTILILKPLTLFFLERLLLGFDLFLKLLHFLVFSFNQGIALFTPVFLFLEEILPLLLAEVHVGKLQFLAFL